MKFALCSDIHLEFGPIELKNELGADVLILSGDICVAKDLRSPDPYEIMDTHKSAMYQKFFRECCEEFKDVIYVMGNHEHYHGDIKYTYNLLNKNLGHNENLHIMEKEAITIGDVTFVCGTLWTDMNKQDPNTMYGIKGYMNDYKIISDSRFDVHFRDEDGNSQIRAAKFCPEQSVVEHKEMLAFIDEKTKAWPWAKYVVVGHHAPSKLSTKPQYEKDVMVNGAYSSDLSEFILDRPQIKVWTHGHTHHNFDYMIGSTRIVANPRGYDGFEPQADKFQLQYIEV
jgi:Icc-related predicted phosphoesterase